MLGSAEVNSSFCLVNLIMSQSVYGKVTNGTIGSSSGALAGGVTETAMTGGS